MPRTLLTPSRNGFRDAFSWLRAYLVDGIRVDTRSLAVFRVFAGVLVIADVLLRSRNLRQFYSDDGLVPRSMAIEASADYAVSVFYLSGDPRIVFGLLLVQAIVAFQLIVGYRTRVATIVTFLFVISMDHRNPFVLSYADTLFRLLLFWAIFLPLGERWSVDAVHRDRSPRDSIASVASFFILLQMVFMYVGNGINKHESELWQTGEAAPLVLGLDNITFLFGEFTRNVPTLLTYGGLIWYYMVLFAWVLFLLRGRLRMVAVGMFVAVHASFAVTVRIGAFPYVALLGLLPFLQGQFWRDLSTLARRLGFDATVLPRERFVTAARRVPDLRVDSPQIRHLRTSIYTASVAVIVASVLLVAAVMAANAGMIAAGDSDEREQELERILDETDGVSQIHTVAQSFKVDQRGWNIFAPNPRTHDRYHVFPAQTADGELLDVYNDREHTFDRPYDQLQRQFDTYRERFYMSSIRGGDHPEIREELARYYCTDWAVDNNVELTHVNMYHVTEDVTLETLDDHQNRERGIWRISKHTCSDHEPKDIVDP